MGASTSGAELRDGEPRVFCRCWMTEAKGMKPEARGVCGRSGDMERDEEWRW